MHSGPKKKVFREKLDWRVKPRTDTHNEDAIENFRRSTSRPQVYVLLNLILISID